jgi:hypothetical protein
LLCSQPEAVPRSLPSKLAQPPPEWPCRPRVGLRGAHHAHCPLSADTPRFHCHGGCSGNWARDLSRPERESCQQTKQPIRSHWLKASRLKSRHQASPSRPALSAPSAQRTPAHGKPQLDARVLSVAESLGIEVLRELRHAVVGAFPLRSHLAQGRLFCPGGRPWANCVPGAQGGTSAAPLPLGRLPAGPPLTGSAPAQHPLRAQPWHPLRHASRRPRAWGTAKRPLQRAPQALLWRRPPRWPKVCPRAPGPCTPPPTEGNRPPRAPRPCSRLQADLLAEEPPTALLARKRHRPAAASLSAASSATSPRPRAEKGRRGPRPTAAPQGHGTAGIVGPSCPHGTNGTALTVEPTGPKSSAPRPTTMRAAPARPLLPSGSRAPQHARARLLLPPPRLSRE